MEKLGPLVSVPPLKVNLTSNSPRLGMPEAVQKTRAADSVPTVGGASVGFPLASRRVKSVIDRLAGTARSSRCSSPRAGRRRRAHGDCSHDRSDMRVLPDG